MTITSVSPPLHREKKATACVSLIKPSSHS